MPDPLAKSFYRRFTDANTGWLRRLAPLVLWTLLVIGLGSGSSALLARYYDGVLAYRTPLAKFPPPNEATEPVVPQVVVVLVDGLRSDVTPLMPTWQRLQSQGASASASVPFPAAPAAWTTLVTGADPEINDAPLYGDVPMRAPLPESLLVAARRSNLNVALSAGGDWQAFTATQPPDEQFYAAEPDDAISDRRVAEKAVAFLTYFAPNLALVRFSLPDSVAQRAGANGDAYVQAVLHTDQLLAQVAGAIDLSKSVLIVASSYGSLDQGGHNGPEEPVTRVPLLVAGAHVKPGAYGTVCQCDLAPTVAALVGSGIPSLAQGMILFSLFDLTDIQRASKAIALANQQRAFGQAYLNAIGGRLSEPALADPEVAKSSLEVKNYESAYSIANLAAQQVQQDTAEARLARIERERLIRAPLAAALVVLPLLFLWLRRSARIGLALFAGAVIALTQHGLYIQALHGYSLAEITNVPRFVQDALQRATLAVLAGALLVIVFHWRDQKPSRVRVATTLLIACTLSLYLLSIPFAAAYFANGLSLQWYLPDLRWAFVEVFSLLSMATTSVAAVPLAVAAALFYWTALIVAHRVVRARVLVRHLPGALSRILWGG